jgi:hypothetical protein
MKSDVARVERSETRGLSLQQDPDFASLNPGYGLTRRHLHHRVEHLRGDARSGVSPSHHQSGAA